ncbi:MAG: aconitate hydratase, partial [Myxococcota bacterium]
SNLKKQGVLPLRFENLEGYEKARETDRVSTLGLGDLAPGSSVRVVFHHEDGSEDVVLTRHTLNHDQIAWFRAGSALTLLGQGE